MLKKIFLSFFFSILLVPTFALAQAYDPSTMPTLTDRTATVTTGGTTAKEKVAKLTGNAIKTILGIIGSISLVILIYAGVTYMTARGNAEQSKEAVKTAIWAFLGVAMVFLSYLILNLVFNALKS